MKARPSTCPRPSSCSTFIATGGIRPTTIERTAIWDKMLAINADQVFTIGIVNGTQQPVVVDDKLRNVPEKALYSTSSPDHSSASTCRTRSGTTTKAD